MEEYGFLVKHGRGGVISVLAPGQDKPTRCLLYTSGGGAAWYFKIYRPKHQQADQPEEDDGGEYPDYDEFEDDGPPSVSYTHLPLPRFPTGSWAVQGRTT